MIINEQLLDLVNSGRAWAFVGSGVSIMAGVPDWTQLAIRAAEYCVAKQPGKKLITDFQSIAQNNPIEAFATLERSFSRSLLDDAVALLVNEVHSPGQLHEQIAAWPFEDYVTTNYDSLLEIALRRDVAGWTSVGNTAAENSLVCRDVDHIVWHPHGLASDLTKNSRLVLSAADYDELYSAGSPTESTLDTVLRMKRAVFIGFGFRDPDLLRILQRVARLTTPDRPAFAFLANCDAAAIDEIRRKYNVVVISYIAKGRDHSHLCRLLDAYSALVIGRNVVATVNVAPRPEFDEQVTSLLTHNRLLRHGLTIPSNARESLLRAYLLRYFMSQASATFDELKEYVTPCGGPNIMLITKVLKDLEGTGILGADPHKYWITPNGKTVLAESDSFSKSLYEQFRDEVRHRVATHEPRQSPESVERVTLLAAEYFLKIGRECGLAIGQQLTHLDAAQTHARQAAILRGLQAFLKKCRTHTEALALINTAKGVLGSPNDKEKAYLGYLAQAYFGQHVLNANFESSRLEQEHIKHTVFLLDASFLIQLLGPFSQHYQTSRRLFDRLRRLGAPLVTTTTLVEEVAEHARFAYRLLQAHGANSPEVLDMVNGVSKFTNVFLESYLLDPSFGPTVHHAAYFDRTLAAAGSSPNVYTLAPFIESLGVAVIPLDKWDGFNGEANDRCTELEKTISKKRSAIGTFRHERQVRAEAEVTVIIAALRDGVFSLHGKIYADAFFVSQSRILDALPGYPSWMCMAPSSLLDWLMTLNEITRADAIALFDQILRSLASAGLEIIPRSQLLKVFGGIVDASKSRAADLLRENRDLIKERYGANPDLAFADIDPLYAPRLAATLETDVVNALRNKLADAELAVERAQEKQRKAEVDKEKFDELKRAEKNRRQASKKRGRREASRSKKKGRKRK